MKYSDHTRNVINKSISLDLKCQRFLIYAKRVDISTMQKCQFSYFTICFCYSPSVIIAHTTYFKQTTSQSFCSQLNLKKKVRSLGSETNLILEPSLQQSSKMVFFWYSVPGRQCFHRVGIKVGQRFVSPGTFLCGCQEVG